MRTGTLTLNGAATRVDAWHKELGGALEGAMLHCGEELLELDRELHEWRRNPEMFQSRLAEEVVDVLLVLLAIAGEARVDLEDAFEYKQTVNETSQWIELSPGRFRRVKGSAYDGS